MENTNFDSWCEKATEMIRYGPDRKAVSEELRNHLQDHYEALLEQDLSPNDAISQSLAAMGKAEDIAPHLAAIHKPFWGYLEFVSRYIAYLLCCVAVVLGLFTLLSYGFPPFDSQTNEGDSFAHYEANPNMVTFLDYDPNVSVKSDGYTFTVSRVGIWQWRDIPGSGPLCVKLDIRDHTPWTENLAFVNYIWVEDSLGNRYRSEAEWLPKSKSVQIYNMDSGLFYASFDLILFDFPVQEAEWINICYDRDGRDVILHIDLAGGDAQ